MLRNKCIKITLQYCMPIFKQRSRAIDNKHVDIVVYGMMHQQQALGCTVTCVIGCSIEVDTLMLHVAQETGQGHGTIDLVPLIGAVTHMQINFRRRETS